MHLVTAFNVASLTSRRRDFRFCCLDALESVLSRKLLLLVLRLSSRLPAPAPLALWWPESELLRLMPLTVLVRCFCRAGAPPFPLPEVVACPWCSS